MPLHPCAETKDGVHVIDCEHPEADVVRLGDGVDAVGVVVRCAACGLHAGFITVLPADMEWRAERPSLPAIVKRSIRIAPRLTVLDGGKKHD
jgi:hypothetical protein